MVVLPGIIINDTQQTYALLDSNPMYVKIFVIHVYNQSLGSKGRLPEVDMSKYDVEPFVKQKQSSLPKSNLQVLKDLILQGNHPLLAPLKKRSGLVIPPEPEKDLDPNDKTDSNGVTERIEGYNGKCQSKTAIRDLSSLSSGSRPIKNPIPAKRGRRIEGESGENHGIMIDECEPCLNPTKKHKSDVPVCQSSPQRTELVESQCPRNLPHKQNSSPDGNMRRCPCSEEEVSRDKSGGEKNQDIGIDEAKEDNIVSQYPLNADVVIEVSEGTEATNGARDDCEHNSVLNMSEKEKDNEANKVSQGKEGKGKVNGELRFMPSTSYKKKDDVVNNHDIESSSHDDGYNDEMANIATKKHLFLSSQFTYTRDSMTEINLCVKCHKSGNLLVCGSNTCPLVVHGSCLGCKPTYDKEGNFYCPFCACFRAHSEYLALRRKFSLERKDVTAFIGSGNESQLSKSKKNRSGAYVDFSGRKEAKNVTNENGDDDLHEKEPSVQCLIDDPPSVEICHVWENDKMVGEKKGKDKGVVNVDKSSTNHDCREESVASIHVLRSRKQDKPYTLDSSFPQLRRKKLPWTKEEEETLKEGVTRFSDADEKWKTILEFGSNVFIKGRTTIDLIDKWRNICKRSPKSPK